MMHGKPTQEHDVTLRLVVTRRVHGAMTSEKRHRAVKALRRLLSVSQPYQVDLCEVVKVEQRRHT